MLDKSALAVSTSIATKSIRPDRKKQLLDAQTQGKIRGYFGFLNFAVTRVTVSVKETTPLAVGDIRRLEVATRLKVRSILLINAPLKRCSTQKQIPRAKGARDDKK
jgi:hypothetical protein